MEKGLKKKEEEELLDFEWKESKKKELVVVVKVPRRNSCIIVNQSMDSTPPGLSAPTPSRFSGGAGATSLVINSSTDVDRKMLP